MKRAVILAAMMAMLTVAAAFGAVQDFGKFTIDVPAGWTAEQDGTTVGIVKGDSTASMSITIEENDGTSLKDLADAFVKELNGKNLKNDDQGNAIFEFTNANGVTSTAVLNCDAKSFALLVLTIGDGASNETRQEMGAMLDSFNMKN